MSDFKVDDWVCFTTEKTESTGGVYEVVGWHISGLVFIQEKDEAMRRVLDECLRHATKEEEKAGRRLS